MPVNITEDFVRQLMAQVDFLTKQKQHINSYCCQHESDN